jgi:hypothetical protein
LPISLLDRWRLHKNYTLIIIIIIIINLNNKSGFFVRYISYFIFNLVDNPGFEDIDISIFNKIILLKTKYFTAVQIIDFLFLGYLE